MNFPMVSICCVTYNHFEYIKDCIEGFLMQKTNFEFEIIIHDDYSADGTLEILLEYEKKYPKKFKLVLQNENQWSKGVRGIFARFTFPMAKGKYIALCEGDDYWTDPLKLQKQVDFLEENEEYAAVFHNSIILNEVDNKTSLYRNEWDKNTEVSAEQIISGGGGIYPTVSIMFRANASRYFNELPEGFSGDTILSLSILLSGKFYYINEVMSVYRLHSRGVYSELVLNNNVSKLKNVWLSNINILIKYNDLSKGEYTHFVKSAIKKYYIRILSMRKINVFRDFRYLIKIPIRDALYLLRKSLNL